MFCFRLQGINHTFPLFIEVGANMGLEYNKTEDFATNKVKSFKIA